MIAFPHIPRDKHSLANSRPHHGIGINDAPYRVYFQDDGKQRICPFYNRWRGMFRRCYDPKYHKRQPTYIGCSVDSRWHSFMAFRAWMVEQNWEGRHLDKDIIVPGNKVYSPENCMFVPQEINALLNDNAARRGKYPQGVHWHKQHRKFASLVNCNGRTKHLGYFDKIEHAEKAYLRAKADYIRLLIPTLTGEDPRLVPALERIAADMELRSSWWW